jgi:hypothetical protein
LPLSLRESNSSHVDLISPNLLRHPSRIRVRCLLKSVFAGVESRNSMLHLWSISTPALGPQYAYGNKPANRSLLSLMARYLHRNCPHCNGYLGIVLNESGRSLPLQAVNGHCAECGHRLAWIIIRPEKIELRRDTAASRPNNKPQSIMRSSAIRPAIVE